MVLSTEPADLIDYGSQPIEELLLCYCMLRGHNPCSATVKPASTARIDSLSRGLIPAKMDER